MEDKDINTLTQMLINVGIEGGFIDPEKVSSPDDLKASNLDRLFAEWLEKAQKASEQHSQLVNQATTDLAVCGILFSRSFFGDAIRKVAMVKIMELLTLAYASGVRDGREVQRIEDMGAKDE